MKQYGIGGAFVGRQTRTISDSSPQKLFRDRVLRIVARAAVCRGRVFYINYHISEEDINDVPPNKNGNVFVRIKNDIDH